MGISILFMTVASLAAFVFPLVALAKKQLGLKGRVVFLFSLALGGALGAAFAAGGLTDLRVLPAWPPAVGGAFLGVLAGAVASGGRDAITSFQASGAKLSAAYSPPVPPVVVATTTAEPCDSPQGALPELPATMAQLPDAPDSRPATREEIERVALRV